MQQSLAFHWNLQVPTPNQSIIYTINQSTFSGKLFTQNHLTITEMEWNEKDRERPPTWDPQTDIRERASSQVLVTGFKYWTISQWEACPLPTWNLCLINNVKDDIVFLARKARNWANSYICLHARSLS